MKKNLLLISLFLYSLNLLSQCADTGNVWNESWVSCNETVSPNPIRGSSHWLLYDFHERQFLDSTHIWNANRAGESGWGAKEYVIDYSVDGVTWKELGQFTLPRADESATYEGVPGPALGGMEVSKLLITIVSTHGGGPCASLAELFISVDAEACTGIIDICGVCDGPGELNWYLDADDDGLGDPDNVIASCEQPDGYVSDNSDLCDNGALGWEEIGPLFRDNGCNNCHGQGAAGGLDLRSYQSTIAGGNSCGTSILSGSVFVEVITRSAYDGCGTPFGPSMNARSSGEFDAEELELLQEWINGSFPESCTDFVVDIDADGDGFSASVDCDDSNSEVYPGATEVVYNGIDDDCDPSTLDDDLDQDGYVNAEDCDDDNAEINPGQSEQVYNGIDDDCDPDTLDDDLDGDGYDLVEDCDDSNANINPGITETCNDLDDNCNNEIDEGLSLATYYLDADGDGYGDVTQFVTDCAQPVGYVIPSTDCNDQDPNVNPASVDIPDNGVDEDCDGMDASDFVDADGDGFTNETDCNDNDPSIYPGAIEVCDQLDNNCDGQVDEGLALNIYFEDADDDGFGNGSSFMESCQTFLTGYVTNAEDCDDGNANINPDADEEPYNGLDDDCDAATLDDDLDQDGFILAEDCDDENMNINPDAEEIPNNGIDEDCDGSDLSTGTHELSNTLINIYPNPAVDLINIKVDGSLSYKVSLYDLQGRHVKTVYNKNKVSTTDFASGTYLIEVKDLKTKNRIVERIVIKK